MHIEIHTVHTCIVPYIPYIRTHKHIHTYTHTDIRTYHVPIANITPLARVTFAIFPNKHSIRTDNTAVHTQNMATIIHSSHIIVSTLIPLTHTQNMASMIRSVPVTMSKAIPVVHHISGIIIAIITKSTISGGLMHSLPVFTRIFGAKLDR